MTQDTEPIHEWEKGRWLCADTGMAHQCAIDHPGDYVFTYDRDNNGRMIDVTAFWTPRDPDTAKRPASIQNGKIDWTNK